jgi:hypothetical protein
MKIGLAVVLSAAVSQGLLTTAYAQTVDLSCTNSLNKDVSLYVSVDMSAQTVSWWGNSQTRDKATTANATITDSQVTWERNSESLGRVVWTDRHTLDRSTGSLTIESWDKRGQPPWPYSSSSWVCKKAIQVF